jgi:hypothetical protein
MSKIPPQLVELDLQVIQGFLLFTKHGVSPLTRGSER